MPPYWALGFQLCRFGYNSLENLKAAVNRTKAAEIPYVSTVTSIMMLFDWLEKGKHCGEC